MSIYRECVRAVCWVLRGIRILVNGGHVKIYKLEPSLEDLVTHSAAPRHTTHSRQDGAPRARVSRFHCALRVSHPLRARRSRRAAQIGDRSTCMRTMFMAERATAHTRSDPHLQQCTRNSSRRGAVRAPWRALPASSQHPSASLRQCPTRVTGPLRDCAT